MKTNIFSRIALATVLTAGALSLGSCDDFLDHQKPQGTLDETQVKDPSRIDNLVISAYAVYMSAEDVNSSFSMWNFDVRSDDAYKGGNGTSDGDVFHQLEISQGILTTNWNISDMWTRLYNCISRVNTALAQLEQLDSKTYALKDERVAEMKFLRAYGHFLLKRLYKNIPFVMNPNLTIEDYNNLSNTEYTNDEGWQLIINDLEDAYKALPVKQKEVGRPSKAAAAAFLTKVYLYKAYHQDNAQSNEVTSISADDLKKVVEYSDPSIYQAGGFDLEADFHNNFRPEAQYENGVESIWAIQYSMNDGTKLGNLNWSYGLIVPNIAGVTDGGCDFYKPSQNMVNAFRTNAEGLPLLDTFNDKDYDKAADYADPRLFLTVGIPGLPYEFNSNYMMDETDTWSRSHGLYGYYVTLKQNVDPDCGYLIKGSWWGTPENRIVFRYADVLLERAEALVQLNDGRIDEAISLVNKLRTRAKQSMSVISNYETDYGVRMNIATYKGSYDQAQALKIVKMERRVEMGMESERFFDLVRWGEAAEVLNKYYAEEADACNWMLQNVPNSLYVSFDAIKNGSVDLSECKLMWWHFHKDGGVDQAPAFEKAAPEAINAAAKLRDFYNNGGAFLLTRYATNLPAYIGAQKDGRVPNNCWGGAEESPEITGGPWSFFNNGNGSHAIYQNLVGTDDTNAVFTCDTGYGITNSTAQWHIGTDWGGYADYATWRNETGAKDLGYGGDGAIVVWEFPATESKGGIICIGSGCYDWHTTVDTSSDRYHKNVETMTMNAINYLMNK